MFDSGRIQVHQGAVTDPPALPAGKFQLDLTHTQFIEDDLDHFEDGQTGVMAEVEYVLVCRGRTDPSMIHAPHREHRGMTSVVFRHLIVAGGCGRGPASHHIKHDAMGVAFADPTYETVRETPNPKYSL